MLKNPLVCLNDDGVPWSDRAIGRICKVSHPTVAKWRSEYLEKLPDSEQGDAGERAVTRGDTTYTMNTGGINEDRQQPEVEEQTAARPVLPPSSNVNRMQAAQHAKCLQQPEHDGDHNHDVQDLLNLVIHRDIGVHRPQQNTDHDQRDDEVYQRHVSYPLKSSY
jgi:hypothetical protein